MAKKQSKIPKSNFVPQSKISGKKPNETEKKQLFKLEITSLPWLTPYLPGILLFLLTLIISLLTYKDYGISWDEDEQREIGRLAYNYVFYGSQEIFGSKGMHYGTGFELPLVIFEKWLKLTDSRDIFLMRHLVSNILFLISAFSLYILAYRLFRNRFIASLGFIMLVFAPRLYAHSFFNTKDLPLLSMYIITLTCCKIAFERNKNIMFFILGILCGYTTGIRIMGIMLGGFIVFFLLIDMFFDAVNKRKTLNSIVNILLFLVGFCFTLYFVWPYLWNNPIHNFIESYVSFSRHNVGIITNLINGKFVDASKLSVTYLPTWFLITNPELWLIAGIAGIIWIVISFLKKPLTYIRNTQERNFLLYLICFFAPVMAVIFLHPVIYDDWRHFYFIYPSFILMALYFINKMLQTRYQLIVKGICILQLILICFFMIRNHPFGQVYFNNFVFHKQEYLRKNYELEYWGCSAYQGLKHLLETDNSKTIKVGCEFRPLVENNIMLLPEDDRKRIKYMDDVDADYFITNFRFHPYDYPSYKTDYTISVLNSTILCIFKQENDPMRQMQFNKEEISILNKSFTYNTDIIYLHTRLGVIFNKMQQYDSAEAHFKIVIDMNPDNPDVLNNLAGIYFIEKDYPKTIAICKNTIKLKPDFVNPYTNVAASYLNLGEFDSGIYYLNKAVSVDPTYSRSYEFLAMAYKTAGKLDSAKKYVSIAQKWNPGFRL